MAGKSKFMSIRTTEDMYEEIKKFAAFQGMSVTDLVLESVMEKIEDWEDLQTLTA